MSKHNLEQPIGVYYDATPRWCEPDLIKPLREVQEWRDAGKGYFVDHGKKFKLLPEFTPGPDDGKSSRGETPASITVREMLVNALGDIEPRALPVIMAKAKIAVWPEIGDHLAIRVGIKASPAMRFRAG
jgi:hypothetical protein